LVQAGTFDEMLSKVWRQTDAKPKELNDKVRSASAKPVLIALPNAGTKYPVLRTNALLITKLPGACGAVEYDGNVDVGEVRSRCFEQNLMHHRLYKPHPVLGRSCGGFKCWRQAEFVQRLSTLDDLVKTVESQVCQGTR
jgi:hypothetical protein